ncbi:MAG TPA: calcium-binding protein, partial [Coleofasciculaceae cyanobacterium]
KDIFDGGTGIDTLIISGGTATTALTLNVDTTTNQLSGIADLTVQNFEIFNFSGFLGSLNATGGTGNDTITTGAGNDTVTGGAGDDTLTTGAGNDILDGGAGTNTLVGGTGDDTYIVSVTTNTLTEAANSGTDAVLASITYTLANNVENLTLTGTEAINGTGNALNNTITGNSANNILNAGNGNDVLTGGLGSDRLIGGNGADSLTGGDGADTFFFINRSDSLLANYDRITDLQIGTDIIDAPTAVSATNIAKLGAVAALTQTGISTVLTNSGFAASRAATFSFGSRTFLALNDGTAGFQETSDAVIEITGFTGNLSALAIA